MLSTPPAFILSQDQTLNKLYLNGLSRSNQVIEVSFLNFKDNELTSSLSLLLPVSLKDSKILLVLRLFSSLFNLQGTSRSQSAELYYSIRAPRCQAFSFSSSGFHPPLRLPRELIYISTLASFCQHLFSNFFRLPPLQFWSKALTSRKRFANIPNETPVVNTFSQLFSAFFQGFWGGTICCFFLKN